MATLNVAGRLGRTAEVRYTASGTAVTDLSIPYSYGRKGEDGKQPTQWVKATLWGTLAESLGPYLEKGKGVIVTLDDVHVRNYQKNDGSTGSSLEGRVISFEFAPVNSEQTGNQSQQQKAQQPAQQPPQQPPQQAQNYQAQNYSSAPLSEMDDDIPF